MRRTATAVAGMMACAVACLSSAVPASANDTVVAGVVSGLVTFAAPGVPAAGQPCANTSLTFSGTAQVAGTTNGGSTWAGAVGLSGSGSAVCESADRATDTSLTVSVFPYATLLGSPSLSCSNLVGSYTRVGTTVHVDVAGACTVNGVSTAGFNIFVDGEFLPTGTGAGITQPVMGATFAGSVVAVQ